MGIAAQRVLTCSLRVQSYAAVVCTGVQNVMMVSSKVSPNGDKLAK